MEQKQVIFLSPNNQRPYFITNEKENENCEIKSDLFCVICYIIIWILFLKIYDNHNFEQKLNFHFSSKVGILKIKLNLYYH